MCVCVCPGWSSATSATRRWLVARRLAMKSYLTAFMQFAGIITIHAVRLLSQTITPAHWLHTNPSEHNYYPCNLLNSFCFSLVFIGATPFCTSRQNALCHITTHNCTRVCQHRSLRLHSVPSTPTRRVGLQHLIASAGQSVCIDYQINYIEKLTWLCACVRACERQHATSQPARTQTHNTPFTLAP